jgi:protein required for attachment to host cells
MGRHQKTWVTTFDGQLARVYAVGDDGNLRHLESEGMDARRGRDDDGRRDTGSLHNAALKQVDEIGMITEPQFVDTFCKQLAQRTQSGAFDRLIVSAAPKALAEFRNCASDQLKGKVVVELNKDYVHTPIKDFESAIQEHLRVGA